MRTFDFTPMFRHSVGFDRMQRLMDAATARTEVSYPPYNIETDGEDAYRVTVAVAGFGEDDLDVTLENETLTISGKKADEAEEEATKEDSKVEFNFGGNKLKLDKSSVPEELVGTIDKFTSDIWNDYTRKSQANAETQKTLVTQRENVEKLM